MNDPTSLVDSEPKFPRWTNDKGVSILATTGRQEWIGTGTAAVSFSKRSLRVQKRLGLRLICLDRVIGGQNFPQHSFDPGFIW